ncbi:hypothetical protein K2173_026135 [Erythroxylum novogranatense]|uniref:Receptor-like serine/threonine-protein kinase n=1 Tax=Erythroxylum novogranatense TaxID=1862640 RepID=A0AAV8TA75_9ROSI|nr:hypothetical protein K2173_026135 [Erythroxylum novogranatense]
MSGNAYLFSLLFLGLLQSPPISCSTSGSLGPGSSLSVENIAEDVLISPNGEFTAGFYPAGDRHCNAYYFSIWFSKPSCNICTVVWMANRDFPVNGRRSKLSLLRTGNLILTDAGRSIIWSSGTVSNSSVGLYLDDNGNLVLCQEDNVILWESFDFPTDTLLPLQLLSKDTKLISSRSQSNISSGFYRLYFDNDNVIRLLFDGVEVSSVYWPDPAKVSWDSGRSTYNNSRVAWFDEFGKFRSTDNLTFVSADYGVGLQRRLTVDFDGNLRLYSRTEGNTAWAISWQAISQPCTIPGICGANSLCMYVPYFGRKCSCLPGYRLKDTTDWSYGCEPIFTPSSLITESSFVRLRHVEIYGYDFMFQKNDTLKNCEKFCLQVAECKGFQFRSMKSEGFSYCYLKNLLLNGYVSPNFPGDFYVRLPRAVSSHGNVLPVRMDLSCPNDNHKQLDRRYSKDRENGTLRSLLWVAGAIGVAEICAVFLVLFYLNKSGRNPNEATESYHLAATGFKRFTYSELKKATGNFSEEIGRGAGGIVYKGMLPDDRVAAVKRLNEAIQAEAEFLAEVSTIGKLNHMNLIEMWGYCVEGKDRLLVYEYLEHGSLAQYISSHSLDCQKKFEIAVGTARGLAYLHEECLEWVLHCDIKPQNILLDSNFQPKVSDFGLSKLLNRDDLRNLNFSKIRGTRGYMAPEWVSNLPITSKVDVYSYGIVVLEMITGHCPAMGTHATQSSEEEEMFRRLVKWAKDKRPVPCGKASWIEEIMDTKLEGGEVAKMETLVQVAMQCIQEDKDARPTIRQVLQMLLQ